MREKVEVLRRKKAGGGSDNYVWWFVDDEHNNGGCSHDRTLAQTDQTAVFCLLVLCPYSEFWRALWYLCLQVMLGFLSLCYRMEEVGLVFDSLFD